MTSQNRTVRCAASTMYSSAGANKGARLVRSAGENAAASGGSADGGGWVADDICHSFIEIGCGLTAGPSDAKGRGSSRQPWPAADAFVKLPGAFGWALTAQSGARGSGGSPEPASIR